MALRNVMRPQASLWLHLDYRTVHYVKVMCDEIFGAGAFRGEIVWVLSSGLLESTMALVLRDDRLVGAVLIGDSNDALWYRDLIRGGHDVSAIRENLIFGRAFCDASTDARLKEAA